MKRYESRLAFQRAVKGGELIRPENCSVCGGKSPDRGLDGHHPDYSKPLEVMWVCRVCHETLPPGIKSEDDTSKDIKIYISRVLHKKIKHIAKNEGVSLNDKLLGILQEYINRKTKVTRR
ncbi:hypothetical protein LCGC14_1389940 [marine sediment metagenome]|uniref:Uncharacterized protein n=1 Tax=marine sediment metagenome TaxID=412755 RepID=A0A0F9N1V0_9ZZZZ